MQERILPFFHVIFKWFIIEIHVIITKCGVKPLPLGMGI